METQYDLLLSGGTVLTLDSQRRVIEPGTVAVSGNRIAAVGASAEFEGASATRTIDCTGSAVIPGFVDCHDHMEQGIVKGLGEGEAVWEWLTTLIFPLGDAMTVEEAVAATRYAAFEAVRAGITCVMNNQYLPWDAETTDAVAKAMESVGLRGVVARGMTGTPPPAMAHRGDDARPWTYSTAEELQIMRDLLDNWSPDRLIRLWPGPNNLVFNDQELIRGCAELAREYGTKWHTHCCEAQQDPDIYKKTYGMSPVKWLNEAGLLGPETTLAHTIWVSDEDIEMLAASGAAAAHNPVCNMYIASGAMRLGQFLEAGVTVGLGIDGPCVGHRMDPFEAMKQTVLLQRLDTLDPAASRSETALELGTRGGAAFTGFEIGSLEEGRLADIAVVDLTAPHCGPRPRAVSAVVNSAGPRDVTTVVIDGRVIVDDGRCVTIDEAEVAAEAAAAMESVARKAGLDHYLEPWLDPSRN
ncbi:MAG: amidohydrolase family protein [Acidimicrobiia bacterium]|nr:amidohydrolase family protein [Acidimicrobiia bacterium]